jgi:hypothetical protein
MAPLSEGDDRRFEAALRGALRDRDPRGDCPEPEVLAAYYERAIAGAELARLDEHFASCTRCRAQLAALARSEEASKQRGRRAEVIVLAPRSRWRVVAPALAAALAIVVVATVLRSREQSKPADEIAMLSKKERRSTVSEGAHAPGYSAPSAPASGMREAEPKAQEAPVVRRGATDYSARRDVARPAEEAAAPSAAAGGAPMAEQDAELRDLDTAAVPSLAAEETSSARAKALSGGSSSGALRSYATETLGKSETGNVEVRSADGTTAWLVGERGLIAMRETHGVRVLPSGVASDLLAGSAPSSKVCWVVGRGSTILRTTDGEKFERIEAPASGDFVSVTAESAARATVRTQHGREFATVDGGRTWTALATR